MTYQIPIKALQKRKVKAPSRRSGAGSGRGGRKRRPRRARTFVQREQVIAIVSALGTLENSRHGPVAFIRIGNKTLLEHALERVFKCAASIVVVVPEAGMEAARALVGDTVQLHAAESFTLGAVAPVLARATVPYVLVHDVRYPFAWPKLMMSTLMGALETGTAVTVTPVAEPLADLRDDMVVPLDSALTPTQVHVPQAYLSETLTGVAGDALGRALLLDQVWRLAQEHGDAITAIRNVPFNIRIGTGLDLEIAQQVVVPQIEKRRVVKAKVKKPEGKPPGKPT